MVDYETTVCKRTYLSKKCCDWRKHFTPFACINKIWKRHIDHFI